MLEVIAPAKVNLFLAVGSVRPDGYHEVTTVLHAIELCDTITIEPAEELSLVCEPDLGIPAEDNLAYRAAVLLARELGREPRVALRLAKRVPHGAGLGGGSSDAAGVIAGLARLWGVERHDERCLAVAAALGSDVPFFLGESGASLMVGRGDELAEALPALSGVPVVLVRPDAPVPTAAAYSAFDAEPVASGEPGATRSALFAGDVAAVAAALANNLENAASAVVPAVAEAIAWVRGCGGALGAAVAGSGSAVFAVCDSRETAERIAAEAAQRGWWGAASALRAGGVEVKGGDEGRE